MIHRLTGEPRLDSVADLSFSGLLVHVAAQTDDGFVIIDVFDSDAALAPFREAVRPYCQAAGTLEPARNYAIHTYITG